MNLHSAILKSALTVLMTVLCAPLAWAQASDRMVIMEDSARNARMDSIYAALNDTAAWQRELDFVRNLSFDELEDSSLVQTSQAEPEEMARKRMSWKEKEDYEISRINLESPAWEPEPRMAVWMSLLVPGGGQIYNRKYWKLPIVYGGYVGCIYALTWNQSTYKDYQNAYVDIMDDDPNTRSYEDFLPPHYEIDTSVEDWLKDVFKQRKNKYRRYRDLSIFAFAGLYAVAAIDAYVDAELSHFDISSDLSFNLQPNLMLDHKGSVTAGFSLAFNF